MGREKVRVGRVAGRNRGPRWGRVLRRRRICEAPVSERKSGAAEADRVAVVGETGSGAAGMDEGGRAGGSGAAETVEAVEGGR